jgi:hypothetical protein
MRHVWDFAENDQRPAVLDWIQRCRPAGAVLDIGPGDVYYMNVLRPHACILVEPNALLRAEATAKCRALCSDVGAFALVADLLKQDPAPAFDLVLMIHVLFYMAPNEIEQLLGALKGCRIAMVHPLAERSVTVEFEESIGMTACRDRMTQKQRLLGPATSSQTSDSHFRLPIHATDEDLAYLVSHPTLEGPDADARLAAARQFVRHRRKQWTRTHYIELPQAQVLETYNF